MKSSSPNSRLSHRSLSNLNDTQPDGVYVNDAKRRLRPYFFGACGKCAKHPLRPFSERMYVRACLPEPVLLQCGARYTTIANRIVWNKIKKSGYRTGVKIDLITVRYVFEF